MYWYLEIEKHGYKTYFGEDCVECFTNEMLEIETYMKQLFENNITSSKGSDEKLEIELKPITKSEGEYENNRCRLCETDVKN